jgi:hypothetical protein
LLRGLTFGLLLLLLFNPMLPTAARPAGSSTVVILDASLSMELPVTGGTTRWAQAVAEARRVPGAPTILLAGAGSPRQISRDSLDAVTPTFGESRLLPALQVASESGARKVIVITDGAIEDLGEVQRWLPRLGVEVEFRPLGTTMPADRALTEVSAPAWAEPGKPMDVRIGMTSTSESSTPVRVTVRADGAELGSATIASAPRGRISTGTITVTPSAGLAGKLVRFDVALQGTDAVPDDDRRSVYVLIGEKPTGVAIVSLAPDWEPRFLHPVLEQAIGLPVRSFYRAGPGTFVTGGVGMDVTGPVTDEKVRAAVREADLLVIHGLGFRAPDWVMEAVNTRPRVLVLPSDVGTSMDLIDLPAATPGDWFVSTEVPASPVASLVSDLPVENLPPLVGIHLPRSLPPTAWVPLEAMRSRRGASVPIAFGNTAGGRRRVIALGQGYWRWSFRGGEQRVVYARFWGALAGWLVQEQTQVAGGAVRPANRVVQRGERLTWLASGLSADSIRIRLLQDTTVASQTTIPVQPGDSAFSPSLPPGNYQYEARAFGKGQELGAGTGPLTVETFSTEQVRPGRPLTDLQGTAEATLAGRLRGGDKPLRTMFWPYLVVALLLASEWILRRRWGLR